VGFTGRCFGGARFFCWALAVGANFSKTAIIFGIYQDYIKFCQVILLAVIGRQYADAYRKKTKFGDAIRLMSIIAIAVGKNLAQF